MRKVLVNFVWVMHIAAISGIVRLMLDCGATDYGRIMAQAAISGHENIVRLMLDQGANNYNEVLNIAASQGHLNIVELILERRNPSNCHH